MLEAIRNKAKGFLAVLLFGMLIASFAIWGIGDIFRRGAREPAAASVGGQDISQREFSRELQREVKRLQPLLGGIQLDAEKMKQLGLYDRVIDALVTRRLFDLAAARDGITISTALVSRLIQNDPAFKNDVGEFDRRRFEQFLYNNQLSEQQFIALMQARIGRDQLIDSIAAGSAAPEVMAKPLFEFRLEKRAADVIAVPRSSITTIGEPDADALATFYRDHEKSFMAPEYRAVSYVMLMADAFAKGITIPEDKIKEEYETRISEFETRETRDAEQIVLPSKETAEHVADLVRKGKDFAATAKEAIGQPPIALGSVTRDGLEAQAPALADAVFALPKPGIAGPVETPFGWHVVRVSKITPGRRQRFEEVRGEIAKAMAREQALDSLYKVSNKLEDELAGGASLEEAAKRLELKLSKLADIDQAGRDRKGAPVAGLPGDFVKVAFSTEVGRDSRLTEIGGDGYFLLHVDSATPPAPRPLDTVRAQVAEGWKTEQREAAAKAKAESLLEKLKSGSTIETLIQANKGLTVLHPAPFGRTAPVPGQGLSAELIARLFEVKPGESVMAPGPEGYFVATLREVKRADAKADPAAVARTREELRAAIGNDIVMQYLGALRTRYPVTINRSTFEKASP
ncbi:MAG: SurA N-terminal domain-containing protein [Alphaproteobacteria bacterium]